MRLNYIHKILLLGLMVWVAAATVAQTKAIDSIVVHTFAKDNKVQLKWAYTDRKTLELAKTHGFEVIRYEINRSGAKTVLGSPVKLTSKPIKPLSEAQIKQLIPQKPELKQALLLQAANDNLTKNFNTPNDASDAQGYSNLYFGFGLFAAAVHNSVAEANALFFEDVTANLQKEYAYKVSLVGLTKPYGIGLYHFPSATMKFPTKELKAKMYGKRVNLTWYHNPYSNIVYYNVYRSTKKDKGFEKLNDLPFVGDITNETDKKSNYKRYIDSVELGKTYYYKVVGVNMFETEGIYSQIVKIDALKQLEFAPAFKSVLASSPTQIIVTWETEAVDLPWIKYFNIYHSYQPDKNFKKINTKPLSGKTFTFTHEPVTYSSNYYLICAAGKGGDSVFSNTKMILLEDNTPPVQPKFVQGVCDTNGIVTLRWKKNEEMDLLGYRVFRSFEQKSEEVRITDGHLIDTVFYDTLGTKRVEKKVYYTLYALDNHVNPSIPSLKFPVRIPDRQKPAAPQLLGCTATKKGMELEYIRSGSDDLMEQRLLRKSEFDMDWQVFRVFSGDSLRSTAMLDTATQSKRWYQYTLVAIDSSGNESEHSQEFKRYQENKGGFPKVKNLQAFVGKPNKMVKLIWDFDAPAGSFTIYRGAKDKPMIEYMNIKGEKREFYDDYLTPNTKYRYKIVANLPEFRPSLDSDIIEVKY